MQIIAPALRSMVAYFNWTRIALLTQEEGLFTGVCALTFIFNADKHCVVKGAYHNYGITTNLTFSAQSKQFFCAPN